MMKTTVAVFLTLLMSGVNGAWAASSQAPSPLLFSGKPVDSLCFFNLESNTNLIQLNNCGIVKDKFSIKGQNANLIKKGFIGFDWEDKNVSYPSQGYSYYKVFDAGNQQYWIYSINNGGGSGDFTGVDLVKQKTADTLEVNNVMGGDRCNGGIQDVKEKNHRLSFSVNLTAYDFLPLANENPHNLKAYDDLASCAVCCVAKAFYEVDATHKPKLNYVDIGGHASAAEMPQQGGYQACFNKLVVSYAAKGESKLNDVTLKKLVKEFNDTCVK